MLLAVFQEFSHPEVLDKIRQEGICEVDQAPEPCLMAESEEEKKVVRTNAKLIKMPHNITGFASPYDLLTEEKYRQMEEEAQAVVEKLVDLGFVVENANPVTSAGDKMIDRVILYFPE